ncbi:LodA/GoxA family CTQ-dependent oxidase [uncultured Bradyrhizobium sp.]|uniref:LodA/GoxA family CTQ-dependent oxidase n=1 Tax=uncultured Bradyrhizobium sp. TaxID=199684 RepID=UPI0035CBFF6B
MRFSETADSTETTTSTPVDCEKDPIASLTQMFVGMVQAGRIRQGQCPALRPVFLKPHGVVHGTFRIRPDLPADLKVGLFAGSEYPAWVRFSSDTLPTISDFKTTVGVGIKLFGVPGPKIFGRPDDTTADFILQNFDVFFVDTAKDMCAFTRAGVVEHDYDSYLKAHPETNDLLNEMSHPVASALGIDYWSCVPFAFGPRFVKYKLEPEIRIDPPIEAPADPTYLAADLERRLKTGEIRFRFMVQFGDGSADFPLDKASVRWDETVSVPIHVADLILGQQDVAARGQAGYGENLSWNIWRVTKEHEPQGSIALARRAVYAASAQARHDVNGIPAAEPDQPKPALDLPDCVDGVVVRAAIHPAIGVARIGDSPTEFFVGPEVVAPLAHTPDFYRDPVSGALKRQAARFRIYGYNAGGKVVGELTPDNADIRWTVHLANRKAQWYEFQAALDIPEAATLSVPRRNPAIHGASRQTLVIDPGPRSIAGKSVTDRAGHVFDTGTFKGTPVTLGELQTDDLGRLLVLGGLGKSASPSGAPVYDPANPNSFNNAADWYDDISDGPVTAAVSIDGRAIPVEGAWVAVAPPNYAPDIIGWRPLYDLLVDVYVQCGWLPMPATVSFKDDILPVLQRLSGLQWVNKGFATLFGRGCPMDFDNPDFIAKLGRKPDPATRSDPYAELRQVIFNSFRPSFPRVDEPPLWPHPWPWIYGDSYGSFATDAPDNYLHLPSVKEVALRRWVAGDFIDDWTPAAAPARTRLENFPLDERPAMLDRAALTYCLADAFHPGCEMTWPMRHASMYEKPFRIRHRREGEPDPDYGDTLDQQTALKPGGPLYAQGPGDITRWMALPWQGDSAFCRSGYDTAYDPYVPTFWPARVPNQVLTEEDYQTVINTALPREQRIAAFNHRPDWERAILKGSVAEVMAKMIAHFGAMGIVEQRPGIEGDPDFPPIMFVESLAASKLHTESVRISRALARPSEPLSRTARAGWESEEQLQEARNVRIRPLQR